MVEKWLIMQNTKEKSNENKKRNQITKITKQRKQKITTEGNKLNNKHKRQLNKYIKNKNNLAEQGEGHYYTT